MLCYHLWMDFFVITKSRLILLTNIKQPSLPLGVIFVANAEATYQIAMVTMFHEHIHKMLEVYVDDILIKSK